MKHFLTFFILVFSLQLNAQEHISEEQMEYICDGISNLEEEGFECEKISAFEEEMLLIEDLNCIDYLNNTRKRADEVCRLWKTYYAQITCKKERSSSRFYPESPLMGRALYGTAAHFMELVGNNYGLDLNVLDKNGETILDWLDAELKRTDLSSKLRSDFEKIKGSLIQYGAKYSREL